MGSRSLGISRGLSLLFPAIRAITLYLLERAYLIPDLIAPPTPLFFVLSIHYLTLVFGKTEFVLRLFPCFFGFGNGLNFIFEKLNRRNLYFPLMCTVIFLSISPVHDLVRAVKHPLQREEVRPIIHKVNRYIQPEDEIYVYYGAKESFKFYYRTKFYEMIETRNIIWGKSHRDHISGYSSELNKYLRKNKRIWFLFSHYTEKEGASIFNFMR